MMTTSLRFCLLLLTTLLAFAPQARAEETVCIQCHGGLEGRLGTPVGQWRGSIHAANGISCHDCHGGDPTDFAMAMSPERGFIGVPDYTAVPDFCGRCHVGVKEDYLASAHGKALAEGGAQCVVCHGNHSIQKASPELINSEDCSRCHEYGQAEEIKTAIVGTDQMLADLETDLQVLARQGVTVQQMEAASFALRNDFRRVFHSVNIDRVRSETAGFLQRGEEIKQQVEAIYAEMDQRKLIGGIVAALFFVASLICYLLRKTYQQEEDARS